MTTTHPGTANVPPPAARGRVTHQTLREMKRRREPIAMLTAYDFPTARLFAEAGADLLLVGDSVATTVLGEESTVAATLDLLVVLTRAVRRAAPLAFVMGDMPFGSYPDVPTAVANAARFVREAGADGVKLEADLRHRETVTALSAAGIVTCAHIGLLPQRAAQQGGYVAQGRTAADARRLVDEAAALAAAGAHQLLIEAVPDEVTAEVVRRVGPDVVVLGCGGGPSADGHVQVSYDMLGYNARVPRFVERYGDVAAAVHDAARRYVADVKARTYPAARHQYHMKSAEPGGPAGGAANNHP
jgi:3-methyl-2-oxobutanoate hydroxymethyltransferase